MSTHSTIAVQQVDGSFKAIYCQFDGYPSGVGEKLLKHYNTPEAAASVVSLGDLSMLDKSMDCPPGHSFRSPVDGYSLAYARDRGEKGTEARVFASRDERDEFSEAYNYTWTDETGWMVDGKPLTVEMCMND